MTEQTDEVSYATFLAMGIVLVLIGLFGLITGNLAFSTFIFLGLILLLIGIVNIRKAVRPDSRQMNNG
jgi:uncharacterized membrane protein HdeD (DUF308 family)